MKLKLLLLGSLFISKAYAAENDSKKEESSSIDRAALLLALYEKNCQTKCEQNYYDSHGIIRPAINYNNCLERCTGGIIAMHGLFAKSIKKSE